LLSASLVERWPQVCRVEITFIKLLRNPFVSATKISMKCGVNWIPLRIRVRSRNTQPHLKLQGTFRRRTTDYRALLRKMTYEDKASYDSTPPCIFCRCKWELNLPIHTCKKNTHTHVCTSTCTRTHRYAHVKTHMHIYMCKNTYAYLYVHICAVVTIRPWEKALLYRSFHTVYIYICIHKYIYTYIHVYTCIYICK